MMLKAGSAETQHWVVGGERGGVLVEDVGEGGEIGQVGAPLPSPVSYARAFAVLFK